MHRTKIYENSLGEKQKAKHIPITSLRSYQIQLFAESFLPKLELFFYVIALAIDKLEQAFEMRKV